MPQPGMVLISATTEWQALKSVIAELTSASIEVECSPFGEYFFGPLNPKVPASRILYFQGGWGKISAAASAQYVIDHWRPKFLINVGTCGGFQGKVTHNEVILVERTIVYDIIEQISDPLEALDHYTTDLAIDWLKPPYPQLVRKALLISADRDLIAEEIESLAQRFGAVAGDWESGALAWVCKRNGVPCLILKAVSDLVGSEGGEVYGTIEEYRVRTTTIMADLYRWLPQWYECCQKQIG